MIKSYNNLFAKNRIAVSENHTIKLTGNNTRAGKHLFPFRIIFKNPLN